MPKGYRAYLPNQDLLLPPSLREWLAEEHLVYFVSDVVDQLDLSAIHTVYEQEKRGQPPYDPRLMTKLLVYGYCTGVFSSRRMQKRLREDIPFKVLATSRTSGPSRSFARSTSKRSRTCSSRSWRWRWSAGRSNWAGYRWTGRS